MNTDKEDRSGERLAMLVLWGGTVAITTVGGMLFFGSTDVITEDPTWQWLYLASPIIPLTLWINARRQTRL